MSKTAEKKQIALIRRSACLGILSLVTCITLAIDPAAFNRDVTLPGGVLKLCTLLRAELGTVTMAHVIAAAALLYLFHRLLLRKDMPFEPAAAAISLLLSLLFLLGMSFTAGGNLDFIIGRKTQMFIAAVVWLGWWALLYALLKLFYRLLDCLGSRQKKWIDPAGRRFLLCTFLIMLFCWLIQGFAFFPGSVPHDARRELNMYFGIFEMNLHHPYFSTMVMGFIYSLGEKIAGPNGGCAAYVLFQSFSGAAVFSRICAYVREKTKSAAAAFCCLAFFAIAPMWWTSMQAVIKDTLYFIVFAAFVFELIRLLLGDEDAHSYIRLTVFAVLSCMFRNGGGIPVIPALLALVFAVQPKRKKTAVSLGIVIVLNFLLTSVLMDALHLKSDNQVEAYSIPLQQIARYAKYHGDRLTPEEQDVIDRIVEYDDLGDRYNPVLADPVKNQYKNSTPEDWSAFWHLWREKLAEEPLLYIESAWNNVYGYTYPFYFFSGLVTYNLYNQSDFGGNDDPDRVYSAYVFSDDLRREINDAAYAWNKVPLLSWIVNPGFYTCLVLVLAGALIRRKRYRLLAGYVPAGMVILVCCASPVNGMLRYMLPVMATAPLYVLTAAIPYLETVTQKEKKPA